MRDEEKEEHEKPKGSTRDQQCPETVRQSLLAELFGSMWQSGANLTSKR